MVLLLNRKPSKIPTRTVFNGICFLLSFASLLYFDAGSFKPGQFQINPSSYEYYYESASSSASSLFQRVVGTAAEEEEVHQEQQQQQQQHQYPFTFGACILTKDDTQILPEWLAYHYTVLPLRHLIVGVDPLSITDPEPLFEKYRSIGMNIEMWTGNWYWYDGRWSKEKKANFNPLNYTADHSYAMQIQRQSSFYTTCLKKFKDDPNVTWVMIVDTDEYFTYNPILPVELEGAAAAFSGKSSSSSSNNSTFTTTEENNYYKTNFPIRYPVPRTIGRQNETIAHFIAEHWYNTSNVNVNTNNKTTTNNETMVMNRISDDNLAPKYLFLCKVFPRIEFAGKDSPDDEYGNKTFDTIPNAAILKKTVPDGFDFRQFHSLRYHYFRRLDTKFAGKSLVNVNLYNGNDRVSNPHRPFAGKCSNGVWPRAYHDYPFRVHHHSGTLETYTSRPGRNIEQWKSKNNFEILESQQDDSMARGGWMHEFVALLGNDKKKAYELTQGAREQAIREAVELKDKIQKSNGTYTPPHVFEWDRRRRRRN